MEYDPDFVASILAAADAPPEASFDSVEHLLAWLGAPLPPSAYLAPATDPA